MKFKRYEACEKNFQKLKKRLNSALILTSPKGTKSCVVYCDAYRVGFDFVLMQNDKVIAYESRN